MTPIQLREATGCTVANAERFCEPINAAIERWKVRRIPEFVAQMAVESARFSQLIEHLVYRTPERLMAVWPTRFHSREFAQAYCHAPEALANYVYSGRMGNYEAGDGWKFRGRGLKQLTGRTNYTRYAEASGVDAVAHPDYLLSPIHAADSAGWYWSRVNGDSLADDTTALTKAINGGLNGYQDRVAMTELARQVFA